MQNRQACVLARLVNPNTSTKKEQAVDNAFLAPTIILVVLNLVAIFLLIRISYANTKNIKIMSSAVDEMKAQFGTDSGTSLRDVANRLEVASDENRDLVKTLRKAVENAGDTGLRIETQAGEVADNLQHKQDRADAVAPNSSPGAASDAAERS